jgi:arylsulfatase A-like enzyme
VKINQDATSIDESSTIEAHLQDAGYRTAIAGKYLNQWDRERDPAYFDRFSIFLGGGYYYGTSFNDDGTVAPIDGYSVDHVESKALEYLDDFEGDDASPWFLYVSPAPPHPPSTPEPRYRHAKVPAWHPGVAVAERNLSDKPEYVRAGRTNRRVAEVRRRKQLRTLYSLDDVVESVFAKLDALDETQDTFVVFISDNGYMWGEHGFVGKRPPYTESIQLPLLIGWPGHLSADTDPRMVANIDLAPTILEVAGVATDSLNPPMDGHSILTSGTLHDGLLFEQWTELDKATPDWASLRTEGFQYVEYYGPDHRTVEYREYYDLREDPHQLLNLLGDRDGSNDPDVEALSARLQAARACAGTVCP